MEDTQSRGSGSYGKGVHHDAGIQDQVVDARQPLHRRRRRPHAGQVRQIQLLHADAALAGEGSRVCDCPRPCRADLQGLI